MARPRSEDKRNAILDAAIAEFAIRGAWSTPTSAVSRAAGVAEGTLFTYFASKEVLVNELYRQLKTELAEVMLADWPEEADPKTKYRHVWDRYVYWGVDNPEKFKVMSQLKVSDQVSDESRAAGMAPFLRLEVLSTDCIKKKLIRDQPLPFLGAMFGAMAETSMAFVAQASGKKAGAAYCEAGFETFWRGIAES
ncbi:TetR/AcrR family transcriptional regulator [Variovorax sp. NFACC27]|uniref:TetR/AcrR family transcriptional regulator n=1 Tax=unclassified Variovorax TaxID=663243 RepID=UPI00089C05B1|nr:transcriptional regulator, TetR family [Variovorax sp. NFACC28]SEG27501.1 transcriptional regulator, TetR family [Variovorax sp. NFACC29]SFC44923.1 transcriptional regulator, TetR family [Variovorax sp. NFACC26]SFF91670.1 transcriptional regulator, TetR family [Variovorax sp. NFACC27]